MFPITRSPPPQRVQVSPLKPLDSKPPSAVCVRTKDPCPDARKTCRQVVADPPGPDCVSGNQRGSRERTQKKFSVARARGLKGRYPLTSLDSQRLNSFLGKTSVNLERRSDPAISSSSGDVRHTVFHRCATIPGEGIAVQDPRERRCGGHFPRCRRIFQEFTASRRGFHRCFQGRKNIHLQPWNDRKGEKATAHGPPCTPLRPSPRPSLELFWRRP